MCPTFIYISAHIVLCVLLTNTIHETNGVWSLNQLWVPATEFADSQGHLNTAPVGALMLGGFQ